MPNYLRSNDIPAPIVDFTPEQYNLYFNGRDSFEGLVEFLEQNGILDYKTLPNYEEPNSQDTVLAVARFIPRPPRAAEKRGTASITIPDDVAFLFDMDGVLFFTPHEKCWGIVFNNLFQEHGLEPFSSSDYHGTVSGKNRYQGIASLLAERGISVTDKNGTSLSGNDLLSMHPLDLAKSTINCTNC